MVFHDLNEAIHQGYQVYDRLVGGGYLLRMRSDKGFVLALCEPRTVLRDPSHAWEDEA